MKSLSDTPQYKRAERVGRVKWPLITAIVFAVAFIGGQDTQERYDEIDHNPLTEGWQDTKPSDCEKPNWVNLRWLDECVIGETNEAPDG